MLHFCSKTVLLYIVGIMVGKSVCKFFCDGCILKQNCIKNGYTMGRDRAFGGVFPNI